MSIISHKGYLISETLVRDGWYITKDGFLIAYAKTSDHAKQLIEELVS